eukprot:s4702_g11.t1
MAMADVARTLGDALPQMLVCLDLPALGSASMVCRGWAESSEACWRQVFSYRWLGSLFELRQVQASWRASCSSRAQARRVDLRVVSSVWHLIGTVRDNKGEMATEADCTFSSGSLAMQGQAVHRRQDSGGHRIILHGVWQVIEIEEEEQVPETPPPSTVVGAFIFVGSFVAKPFSS